MEQIKITVHLSYILYISHKNFAIMKINFGSTQINNAFLLNIGL